jgi:hypothetical protein
MELALRAVSLAVLAWMLWLSLDRGQPESTASANSATLPGALRDWSTVGIAPDKIVAQLDKTPSTVDRDWLADIRAAGSQVSWSGDLPAAAIGVQPIASPSGGLRVLAASPDGNKIEIADEIGAIDTARASNGGAAFNIASASGSLVANVGATSARATIPDSVHVKRVLVIGRAGWEPKFVIAALEEDGWKIDADISVAPSVDVTQGSLTALDTARYSAVIALDNSAASRASDMIRFAENGGGVVLAGSSAASDAFSPLRAGIPGKAEGTSIAAEPGSISLSSLSYLPIISIKPDGIPIEKRAGAIVTAARRFGAGRVVQAGYLDTWRWRMSGDDNAPADHRAWWTQTVASVAYASRSQTANESPDDAPIARLIAALGPATSLYHANLTAAAGSISLWWLFALLSFCLLAEWASRRLRGVA